jgi:hypothetical protein
MQYWVERDVYEDNPDPNKQYIVRETHYGQLLAIYEMEFGPIPQLNLHHSELLLLALVHPRPTNGVDATANIVIYKDADFRAETTIVVDLEAVEKVIGRVELPEMRCFGIIDREMGCARPVFQLDEDERVVEV